MVVLRPPLLLLLQSVLHPTAAAAANAQRLPCRCRRRSSKPLLALLKPRAKLPSPLRLVALLLQPRNPAAALRCHSQHVLRLVPSMRPAAALQPSAGRDLQPGVPRRSAPCRLRPQRADRWAWDQSVRLHCEPEHTRVEQAGAHHRGIGGLQHRLRWPDVFTLCSSPQPASLHPPPRPDPPPPPHPPTHPLHPYTHPTHPTHTSRLQHDLGPGLPHQRAHLTPSSTPSSSCTPPTCLRSSGTGVLQRDAHCLRAPAACICRPAPEASSVLYCVAPVCILLPAHALAL